MRKRKDLGQSGDIAFLLIIFFLLLSGISSSHSLQVALTSPQGSKSEENHHTVQLVLHADGTLWMQETKTTYPQLASLLQETTDLSVHIEKTTAWQQVVNLLALLEHHQIASLDLEVLP